jgi:hypothetical protein
LRKLVTVAAAATATFALVSSAIAQDDGVVLDVTAKPTNAGTKKKPGNVTLDFNAKVNLPGTTVEVIDVNLPKGLKFSGKGFKKCNADDLVAEGISACPSGSKAGPKGLANAAVVTGATTTPLNFDVYPFVESTNSIAFYLSQQGGGVQSVVHGKLTNGGRKMSITIPLELRQPGGLDATLTGLDQTFKGKAGKKKYIVSSTRCSGGRWKIGTQLTFATRLDGAPVPAPESREATVSCKK